MKYSVKQFTVNCETKTFSAEASDLQDFGLPVKLTLLSDLGCEGDFSGMRVGRDEEGDTTHWEYFPTEDSCKKHDRLHGWKVIIFND